MTRNPRFFKLGLFVILAFGLAAAMLAALGAGQFLKTEILAETCFDESVQGLDIGSEVKYKGVNIGTVKTITTPSKIYQTPSNYVLVIFSLNEDCYVGQTGVDANERFKKAIDEGLSATLAFKGLTGAAYLETDYQGRRPEPLNIAWHPRNTFIPSRKSNIRRAGDALNQLLDNLNVANIKEIGEDLAGLVKSLNENAKALNMAKISSQAENLLKELRKTNDTITGFLESDQMSRMIEDTGTTLADLKALVRAAKDPVGNSLSNIEQASASLGRVTGEIEEEYAKTLARLLTSLENTAKVLENMVWINSDTVTRAIKNFEFTAENLNQLTLELKQYPGRLLLERPPRVNTPERIEEQLKEK